MLPGTSGQSPLPGSRCPPPTGTDGGVSVGLSQQISLSPKSWNQVVVKSQKYLS